MLQHESREQTWLEDELSFQDALSADRERKEADAHFDAQLARILRAAPELDPRHDLIQSDADGLD